MLPRAAGLGAGESQAPAEEAPVPDTVNHSHTVNSQLIKITVTATLFLDGLPRVHLVFLC